MKKTYKGIIKQIVGPVIDIKFEAGFIPALKSAIYFEINGNPEVAEVALHQGNGMVKCIAMGATEGFPRLKGCFNCHNGLTAHGLLTCLRLYADHCNILILAKCRVKNLGNRHIPKVKRRKRVTIGANIDRLARFRADRRPTLKINPKIKPKRQPSHHGKHHSNGRDPKR